MTSTKFKFKKGDNIPTVGSEIRRADNSLVVTTGFAGNIYQKAYTKDKLYGLRPEDAVRMVIDDIDQMLEELNVAFLKTLL